jgi:hypothetical protein
MNASLDPTVERQSDVKTTFFSCTSEERYLQR